MRLLLWRTYLDTGAGQALLVLLQIQDAHAEHLRVREGVFAIALLTQAGLIHDVNGSVMRLLRQDATPVFSSRKVDATCRSHTGVDHATAL